MQLVRSGSTEGLPHLISELGGNPISLLEQVGLSAAQFRHPDTYIGYGKLAELLQLCSMACQAPLFGLQLSQRQDVHVLGTLPLVASRTDTLRAAIEASERSLYLHASGVHTSVVERGERAQLLVEVRLDTSCDIEQLLQLSVGHAASFIASLVGCDKFGLTLHLRQTDPQAAGHLRFQHLKFAQDFDGVSFPASWLNRRNHHDEAAITEHLQRYLEGLRMLYPDSLESQVADVIGRLLPSGECSVNLVAATLGMPARTLQSRLQRLGVSYRDILQQTRCNLAQAHLRLPRTSITELALQLGYADVAVFSRHFRQWTGSSPRAWRRQNNTTG